MKKQIILMIIMVLCLLLSPFIVNAEGVSFPLTDGVPEGTPESVTYTTYNTWEDGKTVVVHSLTKVQLNNQHTRYTLSFTAPAGYRMAVFDNDPKSGGEFFRSLSTLDEYTTSNQAVVQFDIKENLADSFTISFFNDDNDGRGMFYIMFKTSRIPPTINLSKTKLTIKDAKAKTITATLGNPDDSIDDIKYSKKKIAEAEISGNKIIITPKNEGKTTITFTTAMSATAKITVTVDESASLNKKSITLKKGETFEIETYVVPSNVKVRKYESDDSKIAKVSKKGVVKAKKKGKTTITVTLSNGEELELKVKVK